MEKVKLYKNKYIDKQTGKECLNSNCFVKLSFIFNKEDVINEVNNSVVSTNVKDVKKFINKMITYESSRYAPNAKKNKHKYLVTIDIMLDKEYLNNEIDRICKKVAEKYDNLPYFAYLYKEGHAFMLRMLFCERHYYEEGIEQIKVYKYGKYIDPVTNKVVKNKKKNSVTVYEKGQKVKTVAFFSNKTKIFVVLTKTALKRFTDDLKELLIDTFVESGAEVVEISPIKQMRYKESQRIYKPAMHVWNNTYNDIQNSLIDLKEKLNKKFGNNYDLMLNNVITIINSEITKKVFTLDEKDAYEMDFGKKCLKQNGINSYNDLNLSDYRDRRIAYSVLREYINWRLQNLCNIYKIHVELLVNSFLEKTGISNEIMFQC